MDFNADPDQDPDPESQTNADHVEQDPGHTLKSKTVEFLHEKYTYTIINMSKTVPTSLKAENQVFL